MMETGPRAEPEIALDVTQSSASTRETMRELERREG